MKVTLVYAAEGEDVWARYHNGRLAGIDPMQPQPIEGVYELFIADEWAADNEPPANLGDIPDEVRYR